MKPGEVKIIELGLINNCVLKCPMCARRFGEVEGIMEKEALEINGLIGFLDKLINLQRVELIGTISEPTMYKDIIPLIEYCKSRDLQVIISTNANVHNGRSFWTEMGKSMGEGDCVKFAVDGATQETYEKYRRGGNLEKVLKNHKLFKENTQASSIMQFILFEHNKNEVPLIKKLFKDEGFSILELLPCGEPIKGCGVEPEKHINKSYEITIKMRKTVEKPSIHCIANNDLSVFLGHTGILSPCCDRDEETFNTNMPTIYNSTIDKCFENLNYMFDEINELEVCNRMCSSFSMKLYEKHKVVQINRDDESFVLDDWRNFIDAKE